MEGLEVNSLLDLPRLPDDNEEDPNAHPYLWEFDGWALGSGSVAYEDTLHLSDLPFDATSLFYLTFYAKFKETKNKVVFAVTSNLEIENSSYTTLIPFDSNQNFLLFNLNANKGLGVTSSMKKQLVSFTFHKGQANEFTKGINESLALNETNFPTGLSESGSHEIQVYANYVNAQ